MKKWSCLLLSVAIVLSLLVVPAAAAGSDFTYQLTFSSGGSTVKDLTKLSKGSTVDVTLTVKDTSGGETFQAYMLDFKLYAKGLTYKEGRSWNLEKTITGSAGYDRIVSGVNEVDFIWTENYITRTDEELENPLIMTCTFTVTDPTIADIWLEQGEIFQASSASEIHPTREEPFTLSLDLAGGALTGASIAGSYYDGTTVTLPNATKTGYDLVNWTDGDGYYEAGATYTVKKDVTITARWAAQTVDVLLSDGSGSTTTSSGKYGETYTLPANPFTKTGYTFTGWSDGSKTYQPGASYTLTGDVTFTAQWKQNATDSSTNTGTNTGAGTSTDTSTDPITATDPVNDAVTTETVTNPDGSTTTVETSESGAVTTTNTTTDGVTGVTVTNAAGTVTSLSAQIPAVVATQAARSGKSVTVPIEVKAAQSTASAPAIALSVPSGAGEVKVDIPVTDVGAGVVAVIVNADGTEEIVKTCTVTDDGVELAVSGDTTVKIVDNTKTFKDVAEDHWGLEVITFTTARTIFNGTSDTTFEPEVDMSRGMLAQVLYNLENAPNTGNVADFVDVSPDAWYADAVAWAADAGVVEGYGNGSFGPTDNITREQMVVMLWRYAGKPTASADSMNAFPDADSVSAYAQDAMAWAIENGIINGANGKLSPTSNATRVQVAAVVMRYCTYLTQH